MSIPRVDESRPAGIGGLICGGYRRRPHIVKTRVYRIARCTVWLCWDCLTALGRDQVVPQRAVRLHRRPIR